MNSLRIKPKEYEGFAIRKAVVGPIATNVYFLINTETKEVLIADPGAEGPLLVQYLKNNEYKPAAILLTHGHEDHIMAAQELRDAFGCPILCHEAEAALLADPQMNCSVWESTPCTLSADRFLKEGEEVTLAGMTFRVLHTPGHTAGSCCFYFPAYELLISGDTLFHGSYGRTDLPTGNDAQMLASVRRLLKELPDETIVYPGHMDRTFIAFEQRFNPLAEFV